MDNLSISKMSDMSNEDLQAVNGGNPWPAAIALVSMFGAGAVFSFNAGRAFVKDIKRKLGE